MGDRESYPACSRGCGCCTRWRVKEVTPRELLTHRTEDRVRITRLDRSQIVFRRPKLVGDTIYNGGSHDRGRAPIAVSDVAQVAVRRLDPIGTTAVVLGTAALGAVVTIGALWSSRAD